MPHGVSLHNFCILFFGALRLQWRRDNVALISTPPVLDCLNSVKQLQPRRLEESFLPQQSIRDLMASSTTPGVSPKCQASGGCINKWLV